MRLLPLDHALRNALRRPLRTLLLLASAGLVAALASSTTAFVRGLQSSHRSAAPPNSALILSTSSQRDLLRSAVDLEVADLVAAELRGLMRVGGRAAVSPEIHMGSEYEDPASGERHQVFLRGVRDQAYLVHQSLTLIEGALPGPGELMVGALAASKADLPDEAFAIGQTLRLEGGDFRISGRFAAPGSSVESEIWLSLDELASLTKRDDCSCVFVRVEELDDLAEVDLFCKRRLDLELISVPASVYYAEVAAYFEPILALVSAMAFLIAAAATTGGANAILASIEDRARELGILRTIGFRRRSLALTSMQELGLVVLCGGLIGISVAKLAFAQTSLELAMIAFEPRFDLFAAGMGVLAVLTVLVVGAIPALLRILSRQLTELLAS